MELQPLEVSPKAWIWKPWRPGESPVILPFTWVAPTSTTYKNEKSAEKHKFNKAYKAERERPLGSWMNWTEPLMLLFPEMRTTALAALIAEGCYVCAQACVCKSYEWQPQVTADGFFGWWSLDFSEWTEIFFFFNSVICDNDNLKG